MSHLLVLPTPHSSSSITLGQLIVDPLDAETASFTPSSKPTYAAPSTQANYQNTVAHDEHGRLLNSTSGRAYFAQDHLVHITAEQSSRSSLANPKSSFEALRHDAATQAFLCKSASLHQPLYFVIGIQTLKNPSFKRAGGVTEATGTPLRLPTHVRRVDSASSLGNKSSDKNKVADDIVFAVELLKLRCCVGAASEPHSLQDIDFEWTYHKLDGSDSQLSIGLGKPLEAAELAALAGMVAEEDSTDASWDSEHTDEEDGIGGF